VGLLLTARPRRRSWPRLPLGALPPRSDARRAVVRGEERAAEASGRSAPQSDSAKRADLRSTILGFDTSRGSAVRVNVSGSSGFRASGFRTSGFRASGFRASGFRASGNRPGDLRGIHPDSSYRFDNSHHHDKGDSHRHSTHTRPRPRAADTRTADTDAYHLHSGCGEAQRDCGEAHGRGEASGRGEAHGRKNTRA